MGFCSSVIRENNLKNHILCVPTFLQVDKCTMLELPKSTFFHTSLGEDIQTSTI